LMLSLQRHLIHSGKLTIMSRRRHGDLNSLRAILLMFRN
jgi:hypothetical protein